MPTPATVTSEKTSQQAFSRKMAQLDASDTPSSFRPDEVREGLSYDVLVSLSRSLGLTHEVLTRVLDVSERTLQRRKQHGRLSAAESDRLWRIAHIYHLALEAFDEKADEARQWLMTPKRALGDDTPIEHLDTEPGLRAVEQMLATIEYTMPA